MPELPEIRAMAYLINSQSKTVYRSVLRHPKEGYGRSKVAPFATTLGTLGSLEGRPFTLSAEARGKELRILFHHYNALSWSSRDKKMGHSDEPQKAPLKKPLSLILQPGMSGHFVYGTMGMTPSALRRFIHQARDAVEQQKKTLQKKQQHGASNSLSQSELMALCCQVPAPFARATFEPLRSEWSRTPQKGELKYAEPEIKCPLYFVDPRKFAAWSPLVEGITPWDPRRGPDPVNEYDFFAERINTCVGQLKGKKKDLVSPLPRIPAGDSIAELMLDQRFFNGVGNIYRAEALYRSRIDPRLNAVQVLTTDANAWLKLEGVEAHKNSAELPNLSQRGRRLLREVKNVLSEAIERKFSFGAESAQWQQRAAAEVSELMAKDVAQNSTLSLKKKRGRSSSSEVGSDEEEVVDIAGDEGFDQWLAVYGQRNRKEVAYYKVAGRTVWYNPEHQCCTNESVAVQAKKNTVAVGTGKKQATAENIKKSVFVSAEALHKKIEKKIDDVLKESNAVTKVPRSQHEHRRKHLTGKNHTTSLILRRLRAVHKKSSFAAKLRLDRIIERVRSGTKITATQDAFCQQLSIFN